MPYIAKKRCKFGGVDYCVGNIIPDEAVDCRQEARLIKSGYIEKQVVTEQTVAPAPPSPPLTGEVPINSDTVKYTDKQLADLRKDDLVALAMQLNVAVDENMTKKQIAEAIIASQSEQDEKPSEGDV